MTGATPGKRITAVLGAGAVLGGLAAVPADAITMHGAGTCPTPSEETAQIAREAAATPTVRAAAAAQVRRAAALRAAKAKEKAARKAVAKARKTRTKADDKKAKARLTAAVRTRVLADRALRAANARLAAVREESLEAVTAWHQAHPCVELLDPPGNVRASAGNDTVALAWDAVPAAPAYLVLRDGVLVAWTPTTSWTDPAAANGRTYRYTVRAVDRQFVSPDSLAATATPAVPAPTGVSATPSAGTVVLRWTAAPHANGYRITRDGVDVADVTGTTWTDAGLPGGRTFRYTVRSIDGTALSVPTTAVAATTPIVAPAAPTGLAATRGDAQVALAWTATPDATGYQVFRNAVLVASPKTPAYTDKGLTNGVTYSYTVKATNSAGASPSSPAVTAKPLPPIPAAPTGLAGAPGDSTVKLTWTASSGATGYRVYRDGSRVATLTGPATTWTDTGLDNNVSYDYYVRATNLGGVSPASSTITATPAPPPPPATPLGLSAASGDSQVVLTWSAVAGATGYTVRRGGTVVATPAVPTWTDTTVVNGTSYDYTVDATNTSGASGESAPVTATPQAGAVLPPAAPTGLLATPGNTQVALSWTAVSGATSYQVLRNGALVTTTPGTAYTDTGLTNSVAYSYTVIAVNAGGSSPASAAVSATPQPPAPAAPTGLAATAGSGSVSLTWTATAGATGYQVLRDGAVIASPASPAYTDSTAVNGTTYSYTVKATNGGGTSPASAAVTATPQVAAPAAPTGLVATAGNNQVALSWTATPGATGYQVLRGGTVIASPATPSYTDTTALNGTAYSYTVKATNAGGTSAASSAATATPTAPPAQATPTGLAAGTATSLNTGAFRLTWTAAAGATSYQVLQDGVAIGTSTTAVLTPGATATPAGALHSYTVKATGAAGTSPASTALSAGWYLGKAVDDQFGRTIYGQIQVRIVVTSAATKTITGCWATYPTTSDSGAINPKAIPSLCSQVLTKQPTSATVATLITNVSGASATSPAFRTSLQDALTQAGM